ncbi:hypothetical protein CAPTEDRAFT_226332 [Capitella teleta]|uniref:Innexin n=1 Tax=Capitella teleta TaxID=283909 RepID=R7TQ88_CAPTE|nr:hypothetical protein CAPTEDRAFT_226332 [Capitella teleta]|eukprot:ELT93681.1 hypothetical protein CAPTEDRAFT_226332 [Capitella teleta]
MLMEAFELLQSAGQDVDTFVTDFAIYKVITILTVYLPMVISTFLLSQEYLGDKIACFAPENFTEPQAESLHEYCWTNGYWISEGTPQIKSLYTQPHRYYPLYLPLQVIVTMSPVILWNIMTKNQLLAILRATEEFLEDLLEMVTNVDETNEKETALKAGNRMRQFHNTCVTACKTCRLSRITCIRVGYEMLLNCMVLLAQFKIYDHQDKDYHCRIPELYPDEIMCTVPTLDLLDMIWSINVTCLLISLIINVYTGVILYHVHNMEYQPMFYNNLPYGDSDSFNENVHWDDPWLKDSYVLLTRIFLENNPIMTKSYVLQAMKPGLQDVPEEDVKALPENEVELFKQERHKLSTVGRKESIYETAPESIPLKEPDNRTITEEISSMNDSATTPIEIKDGNGRLRHRVTISTKLKSAASVPGEKPNLTDYSVLGLVVMHKSSLLAHLDVSVLLGGLATDMEVTLNYLAAIHSETSAPHQDEDKSSGRQIKVLGFQMRILSSVSREYNSLSLSCESCVALHSLLIAINRNCPYDSTTWFHLEIKNQLTGAALMPLVSALLLQENFCQYALSITPDLSQWCEPNSKSLFHKLLDNFPPVGEFDSLELRKEFSLAGSMLINYYPTKCTQNLERLLLSYTIGSKYPEQTFMVIDLWVLLARRGGTQLIYEHCVFLIDLLGSITIIPTLPQVSYIIFLLRRLLKILPENLKASLAKTCSVDVCARVLPTFYQAKADFDRLEKWRNLTTGQDALNLNSCLVRLSFATFDDVTSSKKASSCLMPLWSYLIEENLQHTSVFTVLQAICVSICHVYKSIAAKCSDILRVLELLSKTLTEAKENKWSCLDELMLAALSLLKSLSSRSFAEANHKSILNLLSDLFYRLLAEEEHPVVRHAALETFAYFAEQTSHESVVAESLQRDDGVQERVVTYLNQISDPASYTSTNSISRSAFLLTQREHSQNALPFHVGKWPETNSSHVNPPADKRPRLSNRPITPPSSRSANPSMLLKSCCSKVPSPDNPSEGDPRSIYIHLEQSVSQLEECMPLPFGFRSKLNTLCRRLKLLADTTSS